MDKKTIYGLLLMGLVVFGFMWLQRPSDDKVAQAAEEETAAQIEEARREAAAAEAKLVADSVTPAEVEAIRGAVKAYGKAEGADSTASYTLSCDNAALTLSADGALSGTVTVEGRHIAVDKLLANDNTGLAPVDIDAARSALRSLVANASKYKNFGSHLNGDSTTVALKNDVLSLEISNKGAQIVSATLLDPKYVSYGTYADSAAVNLMASSLGNYEFEFTSLSDRYITSQFYFTPVQESDSTVLMKLDLGEGTSFGIRYTLPRGESYLVGMEIVQSGMDRIVPTTQPSIKFRWNQQMAQLEAGRVFEERNSGLYYQYKSGDVDHLDEGDDDSEDVDDNVRWIGYKNQFFSAVLIATDPESTFSSARFESKRYEATASRDLIKGLSTEANLPYSSLDNEPAKFTFYLGPNSYPLLSDLEDTIVPDTDLSLTRLVPLGWTLFRWINTLIIIPVFTFLGEFISSYGIIILLLTIFIKLILFPFTYKSYMSQAKMRVLAPEIKEINEKYPGNENAMKRQQETMALYSRAGASPLSGCLPMLLQMPILIAMFNFFPSAIELRGESFLWAHNLAAPDAIVSWDFNIPFISSTFGNHISLFCLLMTVVNIIYTKINMQSQPGGNSMPGMKWMMYLMPVMFLVFFNNYAAGLSYYYFLSLLITIGQTYAFRLFINEDKVRAQMLANSKKPKKKGGFMARYEELMRQQQQQMAAQQSKKGKK